VDRQYANLKEEILDITDHVLRSGRVLDGSYTSHFEEAIAQYCHRNFAVAVNSCTQGLIFAIMATVQAESKVLIPGISFVATLNSVIMNNLEPVICDVDKNACIDLNSLDFALSGANISTVMYPNLFGHIVDYDKLKVQAQFFDNLYIIEDAAQSFGAKYKGKPSGSLGDISVLSFDPTKNFNNFGSGGMILTDSPAVYENLRDLRNNGKYGGFLNYGTNSKMSEVDCAQMAVKLGHFPKWQKRRTEIAEYYIQHLRGYTDIIEPSEDVESAWSKFVIRVENRGEFKSNMEVSGVETRPTYINTLSNLYGVFPNPVELRESNAFIHECISLPIYPELTDAEVDHIVQCTIASL
jgi:dTDP-4-amino-4,6-dideoxygalactose transaminase